MFRVIYFENSQSVDPPTEATPKAPQRYVSGPKTEEDAHACATKWLTTGGSAALIVEERDLLKAVQPPRPPVVITVERRR